MKKQNRNVLLLFLCLNLLLHIIPAIAEDGILLNWYSTDDAFYYFKTAQNFGEGRGLSFDGLAPTNGFHPLWMIVCIPVFFLARIDLYLPLRVLIIIQAVLNAFSGYFLYRLFADSGRKTIGWAASFFWMFYSPLHGITTKLGLETGINAFSIFFLIHTINRCLFKSKEGTLGWQKIFYLGFVSLIALFSRLDNIFILIFIGFWLVFLSNQMRWMVLADFLLVLITGVVSYFLRIQQTDNILNFLPFAYMLIAFSLIVKPLLLYLFGLYEFGVDKKASYYLIRAFWVAVVAGLLLGVFFVTAHDLFHLFMGYSRSVLLLDMIFTFLWVFCLRLLYLFLSNRGLIKTRKIPVKESISIWLKRGFAYFIPVFGGLGIYMFINNWYAGSYMPVSGQIKRWWGKMPNSVYGQPNRTLVDAAASFFSNDTEESPFWLIGNPLQNAARHISKIFAGVLQNQVKSSVIIYWGLITIVLAMVVFILLRNRKILPSITRGFALLPLTTGVIFHMISYKTTGYLHTKIWYWIGELVALVIFLGILLSVLPDEETLIGKKKYLVRGIIAILCSFLFINLGRGMIHDFRRGGPARSLYTVNADSDFIHSNTRSEDVIGMTGGGLTSYFVPDRTIVNLDGLINSSYYFELLKENRVAEYLKDNNVTYIYGEEAVLLDSDPYRWTFTDRLSRVDLGPYFVLYKYCPDFCE